MFQEDEKDMAATTIREEEKVLDFMDEIQKIIQETVKSKGLSEEEIQKSLDYKRR